VNANNQNQNNLHFFTLFSHARPIHTCLNMSWYRCSTNTADERQACLVVYETTPTHAITFN